MMASVSLLFAGLIMLGVTKTTLGEKYECTSLGGLWHDNLRGRTLLLEHSPDDGRLSGFYEHGLTLPWPSTDEANLKSVQSLNSNNTSEVIGMAPVDDINTTFAFTVMYDGGASVMSWTAQCMICNGVETLETIWLSQRRATDCSDQWQSTLVGRMSFSLATRDQTAMTDFAQRAARHVIEKSKSFRRAPLKRQPCSILGVWHNELGSQMNITYAQDNYFMGEYRTAVERTNGSSGGFYSAVYGQSNISDSTSAVSFYVIWNKGTSTTEFVGSCLPCGDNQSDLLTTTWVLRGAVETCGDNWSSSYVGTNIFTRYEQVPVGGVRTSG